MTKIIGLAALARSGKDTVASMLLRFAGVAAYALADPLKAGCQALFGLTDEQTWGDDLKEIILPAWSMSPRQMFQQVGTEWMRNHNPEHWLLRADKEINHDVAQPGATIPQEIRDIPESALLLATQAFFGLADHQVWDGAARNAPDAYWGYTPAQMIATVQLCIEHHLPGYFDIRKSLDLLPLKYKGNGLSSKNAIIIKDIRFENEATFFRKHNGVIWHIRRSAAPSVNLHTSELGIAMHEEDWLLENNGSLEDLEKAVKSLWSVTFTHNPQ